MPTIGSLSGHASGEIPASHLDLMECPPVAALTTVMPTAIRTAPVVHETVPIPASHLDLLTGPICGVLTTMRGDGQPQSSLVWVDVDGECARVNTTLERQKGRNMLAYPKVSLLVVDPDDTGRYLQIRGDAELVTDGALDHLDALTRKYTRHPRYYGHIYPVAQRSRETRMICRIHARRITVDAIHGER